MRTTPEKAADAATPATPGWPAIDAWAHALTERIAADHAYLHVAVFVPTPDDPDVLLLVAQRWGAGRDTGRVVPGAWSVPLQGSIVGRTYRRGEPALVFDVRLDADFREYPGFDTLSEMAVPVLRDGRPLAVINLEAPRVSAFTFEDLERVEAVAAEAARTFPA